MFGYVPDPAFEQPMLLGYSTLRGLALGNPGSGAVGTARGIALLWQEYLHNRKGLFDPDLLARAREEVRVDFNDTLGRPMRRSLSFVLAGDPEDRWSERSFFGSRVSPQSFGHQGQGGQVAWADPESGLSFAFLSNTVTFPPGGFYHPRGGELSNLAAVIRP